MRVASRVSMALLGIGLTAAPSFAQSFERGWVDFNFGVAVAAEDSFRMQGVGTLFEEDATFGADYDLPRGAAFDFGGGFMITPIIGFGVSFSGTAHEDVASLDARIPHPILANVYGSDVAETEDKLMRTEGGVNLQAIRPAADDHLRVRFFGGQTYFRVKQDAVTDITYNQQFVILGAVNNITITGFDSREIEGNGWGFHGGGDVSVFFNRIIGVGGFAKFSRGNVDLENTMALSSRDEDPIEVKAGGFQVGGGLRLKF